MHINKNKLLPKGDAGDAKVELRFSGVVSANAAATKSNVIHKT